MDTNEQRRSTIPHPGWTVAVAAALAVAGLSALVAGQRGGGFRGRGGFGPFRSALVTAIDTSQDGTIAGDEVVGAPAALRTLDRDGDGRLAGAELMPAGFGGRGERGRFGGRGGDNEGFEGRRGGGPGAAGEPGETPPPSAEELVEVLMAFDDNADGRLTSDEVPERFRGMFDRADTNKDGALTAEEITASANSTPEPSAGRGRGRGFGGPVDPVLTALDADHDGALSPAEIDAAPTALRSLDRNGDGQLSSDETSPSFGERRGGGFDR